jgi:hypothetical protein
MASSTESPSRDDASRPMPPDKAASKAPASPKAMIWLRSFMVCLSN